MILESGLLGVLSGLIGNGLNTFFSYKTKKLECEYEIKKLDKEKEIMVAEAQAQIEVDKAKIEGEVELADSAAFVESLKAEQQADLFHQDYMNKLFTMEGKWKPVGEMVGFVLITVFGFVDVFRRMMRPTLTAYLLGASTWVTYLCWDVITKIGQGKAFTPTEASNLWSQVIATVLYLTVTCVSWWFADRRSAKIMAKMFLNKNAPGNGRHNADAPF
jgi:hypothetical protein